MDRETRELLDSLEKTNARMLTTLSRVLAGDAEKADQRARMVCLAQRETTRAVYWLTVVVALVVTAACYLWAASKSPYVEAFDPPNAAPS